MKEFYIAEILEGNITSKTIDTVYLMADPKDLTEAIELVDDYMLKNGLSKEKNIVNFKNKNNKLLRSKK